MADSVFLLGNSIDANILPVEKILNNSNAKMLPVYAKIINQFYLSRFFIDSFPELSSEKFKLEDIKKLMNCDYHDNLWEKYMFALLGIFLLIIFAILAYFFSPIFSQQIHQNLDFVYALVIMLIVEILLLAIKMIENMSKDAVFTFDAETNNFILFIPLFFLFIIPILKSIAKKRNLP
jgi:hypothetical protein